MKVLAVAAEKLEIMPWASRCRLPDRQFWPVRYACKMKCNGHEVYAVANGAGPILAELAIDTAVERAGPFKLILSFGLCGALDPSLAVGDICTATSVSDGTSTWKARPLPGAKEIKLLSINRFLADRGEKAEWAAKGFHAVEMEAAAAAAYAARKGLPFVAVKVVSDRAEENFALDFNEFRDSSGNFDRRRIAFAALKRPFLYLPDLLRMATRGPSVSATLGEFLVKSNF